MSWCPRKRLFKVSFWVPAQIFKNLSWRIVMPRGHIFFSSSQISDGSSTTLKPSLGISSTQNSAVQSSSLKKHQTDGNNFFLFSIKSWYFHFIPQFWVPYPPDPSLNSSQVKAMMLRQDMSTRPQDVSH